MFLRSFQNDHLNGHLLCIIIYKFLFKYVYEAGNTSNWKYHLDSCGKICFLVEVLNSLLSVYIQGSLIFSMGSLRFQCLKKELSLEAFNIFACELDEGLASIFIKFVSGPRDGRHNHCGKWQTESKKNLLGWENKRLNQTRWHFTG